MTTKTRRKDGRESHRYTYSRVTRATLCLTLQQGPIGVTGRVNDDELGETIYDVGGHTSCLE
jgi:hypothetical protein